MPKPRLALFDLDHTLLTGDSDVLWCDFLVAQGLLDAASFAARNADMEARYRAGTVGVDEFAGFYVSTLAGRSPQEWQGLRERFLNDVVIPLIPPQARELVQAELGEAPLVAMTTATNRYITELTCRHFGIAHLLATEAQLAGGRFTGRVAGRPNMRAGKVEGLREWLAQRGSTPRDWHIAAYSDSANDLPLLEIADEPVAVNPDPVLAGAATGRGWRVLRW